MAEDSTKKTFGGRTRTSWDAKWHLGKTKPVRIPAVLADDIIEIVRAIDSGKISSKELLELVK